jgi:hypothetical protein
VVPAASCISSRIHPAVGSRNHEEGERGGPWASGREAETEPRPGRGGSPTRSALSKDSIRQPVLLCAPPRLGSRCLSRPCSMEDTDLRHGGGGGDRGGGGGRRSRSVAGRSGAE